MIVRVPKDFVLCPLFAASAQSTPRWVCAGQRRYQLGGVHPLDPTRSSPALDVRHARALLALISFRKPSDATGKVEFSMYEFCRRYARSYGGRYARELRLLLGDLLDSYLRVQEADSSTVHTFRLVERVHVRQGPFPGRTASSSSEMPPTATWIESIFLSPELCTALDDLENTHVLNLELFTKMTSPLAQAIYLYLPSRAHHHTQDQPFEITLTRLLDQVGHPIPATRKLRKKLFTQRATSALYQLNGVATSSGTLRLKIVDGLEDYKVLAWVVNEAKRAERPPGKMAMAFLASGRSQRELDQRLQRKQPLDDYELELLKKALVRFEGNERFLVSAKALLGADTFRMLLSEAKGDVLEGRPATKSPTARLVHRIMEALKTPTSFQESLGTTEYPSPKSLGQVSTTKPKPWDN